MSSRCLSFRFMIAATAVFAFSMAAMSAHGQVAPVPTTTPIAPASASEIAENMLLVLGGRANWARLKNTVNDSQQHRVTEPTEVRVVITMDFERPRFRIETHGPNLHLIRVIDGERTWRRTRDGTIGAVPKATFDDDMRWYAAHVYRTLHRVAKNDPALELKSVDARLEVWENNARLVWFKLNAGFEPYAFGALDDQSGTISGPWKFARDGIRHPTWTARPDGSWRATLNELQTNTAINDATFAQSPTQ
jgi:hypothetical protein